MSHDSTETHKSGLDDLGKQAGKSADAHGDHPRGRAPEGKAENANDAAHDATELRHEPEARGRAAEGEAPRGED